MSGFWRHFHSMLSCRCHSDVCVIYHIKLINISKMHKKFICLGSSITETFFNLFRTVKDVLKCEQKSASPSSREGLLVLTSHVIRVLQHNSIWHIYGNLLMMETWILFLFHEGTSWCLLYRGWNLINDYSWTKIKNATVDMWSSWCLILILNLRRETSNLVNLIKQRQRQKAVGGL